MTQGCNWKDIPLTLGAWAPTPASSPTRDPSLWHRREAPEVGAGDVGSVLVAFMACVLVSNWMIMHVGLECVENGPCLIPVFQGVWAPSCVLLAGAVLVLRDIVQELFGVRWAVLSVAVGGILSIMVSSPAVALASVSSYVAAERMDILVFTSMRRRGFLRAAFVSSLVGLILGRIIFYNWRSASSILLMVKS